MRVIIQCCLLLTWLHTLNSLNAADMEPFLIFTNGESLKKMNLDGSNVSTLKQDLRSPYALDFDYRQQMIYWTDYVTEMISRMHINGSGTQVLHRESIRAPDGLAVDWVGGNLYWSDWVRDTIEVSKLTGEHRAVLVNTGLDLPLSLAVDVRYGYLYWTDSGKNNPHIGRIGMDGTNRSIIVKDKITRPFGLTLDFNNDHIYWTSDREENSIEFANLDGTNRNTVLNQGIRKIYAISLFEDHIYWREWDTKVTRSISRAHKTQGTGETQLFSTTDTLWDIQVYHPYRQPEVPGHPCQSNNGGCSNLCLLSPGGGYKCPCPTNSSLAADNKQCRSSCTASQFACRNYKCIPLSLKCDMNDDCGDRSDEPEDCSKPKATLKAEQTVIPAGGSVTLTCSVEVSSGWKYWYLNNQSLFIQDDHSAGPIRVSVGGVYRCRAGRGDPVYYTEYSDALTLNTADESGDVRLVGGISNCTGTLEVKHQGEWRTATDFTSDLNLYSSSVVCRQLGCGSAVDTKWSPGSVRKPVWMITSSCNGSEASLKECVTMQSFLSGERLEVTCSALFSQCGRAQPPDVKKVHGGRGSVAGTHPWQVSLRRRTKGSSEPFEHHCGGVLIASCWVLTAAHCINSSKEMQVVLGGVYLVKNEAFDQIIPVVRAIVHPDYREIKYPDGSLYTLRNDVALLELNVTKGPLCVMETRYVKTACLPNQLFPDGKECVITGWGRTKEGPKKRTNRLMEGKVPLISKQNCMASHVDGDSRLDDTMICAGHTEGGVDACKGDSGGPLMCEQDGIHYIAGLVSWGPQCVLNDKPGVYANVHRYVDWIHKKMTNDIDYTYDDYDDYA